MTMADAARKLLVKPGDRVLFHAAPKDVASLIGPLPDGASVVGSGAADVVVAFAADDEGFRRAVPVLDERSRTARAAWIAYPKLSSKARGTLSRDGIRTSLEETTDITPVTQVAIDDTWSALRVRPKDQVGR
jgi:hypothetical protein